MIKSSFLISSPCATNRPRPCAEGPTRTLLTLPCWMDELPHLPDSSVASMGHLQHRDDERRGRRGHAPRTPQLPQRTGSHSRPAWKHLHASVWQGRPFFLTLQLQPGKRREHSRSEQWQKLVQLTLLTWHSHWAIEQGPSWLHGRVLR